MAWIRTALSMLSFGFTIFKFLDAMAKNNQIERSDSPQRVGLFLVGLGMAALLLGTMSYWGTLQDIRRTEEFRLGRAVLLMSIAAVALFIAIARRLV
jgi:putative membrane protein